jgi:hypothetical protein
VSVRAVWSFWSKPFLAHHHRAWASDRHHLLAWILSTQTASRYYRPAVLHTDDDGARMLVDRLGLEFDEVHTTLNALDHHDGEWWALGKLYAYRAEREPFVHLDNDVFLWKRLPSAVESAGVLAQNPEYFVAGQSYYQPEVFDGALEGLAGTWLPIEWRWSRGRGSDLRAECCGIFGGQRTDFIRYYASQAIRIVEHPANRRALQPIDNKIGHNILFEQFFLGACIEYHTRQPSSPYRDITIEHVFASIDDAFDPVIAGGLGYTHLIADAKQNPELADRLERRVARDYPANYERVLMAERSCDATV